MLCPASVPRITPYARVVSWGLMKVQERNIKDVSYLRVEAGARGWEAGRGWWLFESLIPQV